jgi:hypothetical protein
MRSGGVRVIASRMVGEASEAESQNGGATRMGA